MNNSPQSLPSVVLSLLEPETVREAAAMLTARQRQWRRLARPEQLAPGTPGAMLERADWSTWLVLSGRGWGKTRAGVEWVKERVEQGARRIILAAPTAADVRDVLIEGESGLLAIYPDGARPLYEPSKRRVTWANGATAVLLSGEEPERFRGIQGDTVLCDELAAWQYPEAWDLLQYAMRLGSPKYAVLTTPKPIPLLKSLVRDPSTVVSRGSTFDNAKNLAPEFLSLIRAKFDGTRMGRQELYAEILEDAEGALWTGEMIERLRVRVHPELRRVVVAIDPAVSNSENSDETGIIVFGVGPCGCKSNGHAIVEDHGFVLADLSGKHSPNAWAKIVIDAVREYGADRVVAEVNNGGDLVEANLRTVDRNVAYTAVHASRAKRPRAEPVAALYEQGKIHHVGGFAKLEDQMTTWEAMGNQRSPDRMDALVWAATETMLNGEESTASKWSRYLDTEDNEP